MTQLSPMDLLLGSNLLVSVGKKESTKSALGDASIVALYFSASWCPPCKAFTPVLSQFYKNAKSLGVEIVFVSSDRDTTSFNEYFSKMPWLAIPHEAEHFRKQLRSDMKLSGIPTLVIIDPKTGNFISSNGRSEVMSAGSNAKELVCEWKAKDSLPLEKLGESQNSTLHRIKEVIQSPFILFLIVYLFVKFLAENIVSKL